MQCSSTGEVTGSGSEATRQRLRSKTRQSSGNLRVTSPAWLKRRHPKERGNFVPASRAGAKEPGKNGSPNESLAGGAEAARQRKQRQRLRSKTRQPQEDGGSAEGLAAGVTDDLERKSILGQAEERSPKETGSEARFSRRSNRQRKRGKRVNGFGRRQDCGAEPEGYFTGLAGGAASEGRRKFRSRF